MTANLNALSELASSEQSLIHMVNTAAREVDTLARGTLTEAVQNLTYAANGVKERLTEAVKTMASTLTDLMLTIQGIDQTIGEELETDSWMERRGVANHSEDTPVPLTMEFSKPLTLLDPDAHRAEPLAAIEEMNRTAKEFPAPEAFQREREEWNARCQAEAVGADDSPREWKPRTIAEVSEMFAAAAMAESASDAAPDEVTAAVETPPASESPSAPVNRVGDLLGVGTGVNVDGGQHKSNGKPKHKGKAKKSKKG